MSVNSKPGWWVWAEGELNPDGWSSKSQEEARCEGHGLLGGWDQKQDPTYSWWLNGANSPHPRAGRMVMVWQQDNNLGKEKIICKRLKTMLEPSVDRGSKFPSLSQNGNHNQRNQCINWFKINGNQQRQTGTFPGISLYNLGTWDAQRKWFLLKMSSHKGIIRQ